MKREPRTVWIPGDLHFDLRLAATKREVKLGDLVTSILRAGLANEPKPKKK